ncbi:hypothetical protein MFRU_031g01000 [Monilinia fructicola]|nr:hypothetical protein MFRU_031g01000 [Monilinia fructicola]
MMASSKDEQDRPEFDSMILSEDEIMDYDDSTNPNETEVSVNETTPEQLAQIAHSNPLVHRPAAHNVPATRDLFPQSPHATQIPHSIPLVLRPAMPEIPAQQPSTIKVPPRTRNLYRHLRQIQKERREREKEKRAEHARKISRGRERESERRRERARRDESVTSDDFYNRYMEVDPILIRRQIQYLHVDLYRSCGSLEQWTEMKPRDQGRMQVLLEETLIKKLAAELIIQRKRKTRTVEDIKELMGQEHNVEAWREWAKKVVDEVDKDRKDWEECRKNRKHKERMKDGQERPPEYRTYRSFIWDHEIDRAVEEAEREAEKEAEKKAKKKAEEDEMDGVRYAMRDMSRETAHAEGLGGLWKSAVVFRGEEKPKKMRRKSPRSRRENVESDIDSEVEWHDES